MSHRTAHLVFVVNEDWSFYTHRLHLAEAAIRAGYTVTVAAPLGEYKQAIEQRGVRVVELNMPRRIGNPFHELKAIMSLTRLYKRLKPDLVHHVVLKNVLYGSLAAKAAGVPAVVNAVTGLGHLFTSNELKYRVLRPVVLRVLRFALDLPHSCVIFQNNSDKKILQDHGVVKEKQAVVICSAGVNIRDFSPGPLPQWGRNGDRESWPIVTLPARMLWTKGVGEFVEAAKRLRQNGVKARFVLVGRVDSQNPGHVSEQQLQEWEQQGHIEWWGHQNDMPRVLSRSSIVVLPSYYREGAPKVLLEAAACARPVVTTDHCGCRDVVVPEHTALLVPPRDATALAQAIGRLLADRNECVRLGQNGRRWIVENFTQERIAAQTLDVYATLLQSAGIPVPAVPAERKAA